MVPSGAIPRPHLSSLKPLCIRPVAYSACRTTVSVGLRSKHEHKKCRSPLGSTSRAQSEGVPACQATEDATKPQTVSEETLLASDDTACPTQARDTLVDLAKASSAPPHAVPTPSHEQLAEMRATVERLCHILAVEAPSVGCAMEHVNRLWALARCCIALGPEVRNTPPASGMRNTRPASQVSRMLAASVQALLPATHAPPAHSPAHQTAHSASMRKMQEAGAAKDTGRGVAETVAETGCSLSPPSSISSLSSGSLASLAWSLAKLGWTDKAVWSEISAASANILAQPTEWMQRPASSGSHGSTPMKRPVSSKSHRDTPVQRPASSGSHSNTPVQRPASSGTHSSAPVQRPASSGSQGNTPVQRSASSRPEGNTPTGLGQITSTAGGIGDQEGLGAEANRLDGIEMFGDVEGSLEGDSPFDEYCLVQLMWSFATVNHADEAFLHATGHTIQAMAAHGKLSPASASPLAWALSTLMHAPFDINVFGALAHVALSPLGRVQSLGEVMSPEAIRQLALAFARADCYHSVLLDELAAAVESKVQHYTPNALADVLWSLSKLGHSARAIVQPQLGPSAMAIVKPRPNTKDQDEDNSSSAAMRSDRISSGSQASTSLPNRGNAGSGHAGGSHAGASQASTSLPNRGNAGSGHAGGSHAGASQASTSLPNRGNAGSGHAEASQASTSLPNRGNAGSGHAGGSHAGASRASGPSGPSVSHASDMPSVSHARGNRAGVSNAGSSRVCDPSGGHASDIPSVWFNPTPWQPSPQRAVPEATRWPALAWLNADTYYKQQELYVGHHKGDNSLKPKIKGPPVKAWHMKVWRMRDEAMTGHGYIRLDTALPGVRIGKKINVHRLQCALQSWRLFDLANGLAPRINEMSNEGIARLLEAFVEAEHIAEESLLTQAFSELVSRLSSKKLRDAELICRFAWKLFTAFLSQVSLKRTLERLSSPESISRLMWSMAVTRYYDKVFYDLAARKLKIMFWKGESSGVHLIRVAGAYATFKHYDGPLFNLMCLAAVRQGLIAQLSLEKLVHLMRSLSWVLIQLKFPFPLFNQMCLAAVRQCLIAQLSLVELVQLLRSLSWVQHIDEGLMKDILAVISNVWDNDPDQFAPHISKTLFETRVILDDIYGGFGITLPFTLPHQLGRRARYAWALQTTKDFVVSKFQSSIFE
eukprot:gene18715-25239_t